MYLYFICQYFKAISITAESYPIQVFDATNTTRERRTVILSYAKERGYKVSTYVEVGHFTNMLIRLLAES